MYSGNNDNWFNLIAPTVTTQVATSIGTTTATGNGNITNLGLPNPTAHGVCWSTTANPTTADSKVDMGAAASTGAFTASMTGLSPGTTYHYRAYATNTAGTSYGADVTFTTATPPPPTYAVTYNANGASTGTAPNAQTKTQGVNLTLATNTGGLAKTGYTLTGWNTNAAGTGTHYALGATYTNNAAVTLYAEWTANQYTVAFDANSGTAPNPASKQVTFGQAYGELATTTYEGHTFNGWFTAASGGTKITAATSVSTAENQTLHAQWTATTYTLRVRSTGSTSVDITAVPADYAGITNYTWPGITPGMEIILTAPPVADDAPFLGWSGCDTTNESELTCTVTMNASKTVTVHYEGEKPKALPGVLMLLLDEE